MGIEIIIEMRESADYKINLIDTYGKQLYTFNSKKDKYIINLSSLKISPGIYSLKIDYENSSKTFKILIK